MVSSFWTLSYRSEKEENTRNEVNQITPNFESPKYSLPPFNSLHPLLTHLCYVSLLFVALFLPRERGVIPSSGVLSSFLPLSPPSETLESTEKEILLLYPRRSQWMWSTEGGPMHGDCLSPFHSISRRSGKESNNGRRRGVGHPWIPSGRGRRGWGRKEKCTQ